MHWTNRPAGTNISLARITYGNGTFVAVGGDYSPGTSPGTSVITTSTDGIEWTSRSLGTNWFAEVAYGNGTFVTVGYDYSSRAGTVATSPDGTNWTIRSSGATNALSGLTYGGGAFIAAGDGGAIVTSPDGVNWTSRHAGSSFLGLHGFAYGDGTFVAVGDGGMILQSGNLAGAARPTLSGIFFGPAGFQFQVNEMTPGQLYRVEATPGLLPPQWTFVAGITNTQGSASFIDPATSGVSSRFYRVVSP